MGYLLKVFVLFVLLGFFWIINGCQKSDQKEFKKGEDVSIEWKLISNASENDDHYRAAFTFENQGSEPLKNTGWTLFFNYRKDILGETVSENVEIKKINGDFFQLTPTAEFELAPGESVTIEYEGRGFILKESRAPKGLYFIFTDPDENMTEMTVADYRYQPIDPKLVENALGSVIDAESRFRDNEKIEILEKEKLSPILPTPQTIQYLDGSIEIKRDTQINYEAGLQKEAQFLADAIGSVLDAELRITETEDTGSNIISLTSTEDNWGSREEERYHLEISGENGVEITGNGSAGVFYGIQSLLHLIPYEQYQTHESMFEIPALSISDAPRFPYRGMHLDVARNFNDKQSVYKMLDLMAYYKLNKFHFHLTDDEGWRLEIEELPELTKVGAFRGHTLDEREHLHPSYGSGPYTDPDSSHGSGYFTRDDYMDIIRYAYDRHIEVIPEFDTPGHARAAIKAMEARYRRLVEEGREEEADEYLLTDWEDESEYLSPQGFDDNVINVCNESAYRFFETVVDDVVEMHRIAGVPLNTIHMGGDEVPNGAWEQSPDCAEFIEESDAVDSVEELESYFVDRVTDILSKRNLTLAGWQEIAIRGGWDDGSEIDFSFAENDVLVYSWNNFGEENKDLGYRLANADYPVVLCNITNLYFNMPVDSDPAEPGDYVGTFLDTKKVFEFMPMNFTDPMDDDANNKTTSDYAQLYAFSNENILGMQGHLWSEPIKGPDSLEYFYSAELLANAERAWANQPDWESMAGGEERTELFMDDWSQFANRIGRIEIPKMDYIFGGFNYRVPLPGAVIEDGMVRSNLKFPGLTIRYTTDGSTPTDESEVFEGPIEVDGQVKLRSFDSRGRGSRTVTIQR